MILASMHVEHRPLRRVWVFSTFLFLPFQKPPDPSSLTTLANLSQIHLLITPTTTKPSCKSIMGLYMVIDQGKFLSIASFLNQGSLSEIILAQKEATPLRRDIEQFSFSKGQGDFTCELPPYRPRTMNHGGYEKKGTG